MPAPTDAELLERFRYHAPTKEAVVRHDAVNEACYELAKLIRNLVPFSREQALALTELEAVRFRANQGIAMHHDSLDPEP